MSKQKKNGTDRNRKLLFVAVLAAVLVLLFLRPAFEKKNAAAEQAAEAAAQEIEQAADAAEAEAQAAVDAAEEAEAAALELELAADDAESEAADESETEAQAADTAETTDAAEEASAGGWTMADVYDLQGTEIFAKGALKHIFCGTVNSSGNGSGYHYAMIEDADGKIVEGTIEGPDENGIYTADVTVKGKKKLHYSTFFPDDWTPQEVVDAIAAAREDALDNHRVRNGSTWVGYTDGIEIDMYLDDSDKVISAYPVMD